MGDVPDRSIPRRGGGPGGALTREGSTASSVSSGASTQSELKNLLSQVEPLPGSLTPKEVDEILSRTAKVVGDPNVDWAKRREMLKTFKSLVADPSHHPQIIAYLRQLGPPFQKAVEDPRSQLGREAVETVAFIATQCGTKSEFFIEPLLPQLFKLLIANAQVVSITSASALSLIFECAPSFRLIPPLGVQMGSRSKEVRRVVAEIVRIILSTWSDRPDRPLQRQIAILTELMRKGLTDADADTRMISRQSFVIFQQLFEAQATGILDHLEPFQRRQVLMALENVSSSFGPNHQNNSSAYDGGSLRRTNGVSSRGHTTASLSRQGSIKKTSIPVLASRGTPESNRSGGTPGSWARSASAIDMNAVSRARTHQYQSNTMRSPIKAMGRTKSIASAEVSPTSQYAQYNSRASPSKALPLPSTPGSRNHVNRYASQVAGDIERSRPKHRTSFGFSQSQPASRSNSPSPRLEYVQMYNTPSSGYGQGGASTLKSSAERRGLRRTSTNSSASSSRDTSPQGRVITRPKYRQRSFSNSPQVLSAAALKLNSNTSTAKMLLASREAESSLQDGPSSLSLPRREFSEVDYGGNLSDSEDSISSHRSHRSESLTFSPISESGRYNMFEDNVEELLNRCGSVKWSERKEGLLGLQNYLARHGSIPSQYFNRIGQTFCRIFMDAHTKVLSLFLDVLHSILYAHSKDLVDFTTILLNRILTKLGSDILNSIHLKLNKTLEIIMQEMPADLQFSAITHYLTDPTQTPNSRSKIAALSHLNNLASVPISSVKVTELYNLVDKILDWSHELRSSELRRVSQNVFRSLFDIAAPQMTLVLGQLPVAKQDAAKAILQSGTELNSSHASEVSPIGSSKIRRGSGSSGIPVNNFRQKTPDAYDWRALKNEIQTLEGGQNLKILKESSSDLVEALSQISRVIADKTNKSYVISEFYASVKSASDLQLVQHHKEILKVMFDILGDEPSAPFTKPSDRMMCFLTLDELCKRPALTQCLSSYTELFIVRLIDNQLMPREVVKGAENCAISIATYFPPEIITRAICPIITNKEFPMNQLAIKMLHVLVETCETGKLKSLLPEVMSTLICAYDHTNSAVRKEAVFSIVALHGRLGPSDLDPYLSALSRSKLKLLQLYIQRAQCASTPGP